MEKDCIKQMIRESVTKVCQTLNALQAIERQFDDDLLDETERTWKPNIMLCAMLLHR